VWHGFPALQPLFSSDFEQKEQPGCEPILCSSCTITGERIFSASRANVCDAFRSETMQRPARPTTVPSPLVAQARPGFRARSKQKSARRRFFENFI
jgi:hypothetical protein